ncbi:nuclear transport factor 2 family protein [Paraburkholderia sp. J12]|uniref:nuclear transport factor 2 family protein n=1 Tax=Paraburkholderia sp. J12 TaxID=2805432 RepID=UPI002ABE5B76|nr:nuclear transport factor 2 family protein [Paraburkholderia sp. J12]
MSASSSLPDWFAQALQALQAGNTDGYMAIYAADAVHEFPFAPDGAVPLLVGRETIAAYMRSLTEFIRFGTLSDVRAREVGNELIVEAIGHNQRLPDHAPMQINYVWFITLRDGKVVHFRDYMNPLQLSSL